MFIYRILLFVVLISAAVSAQNLYQTYYYQNEFALTSAGAMRYGMYGSDNPALLSTLTGADLLFTWSDQNGWRSLNRWGLFAAVPNLSFNINRENWVNAFSVTDYKINTAVGDKSFGLGIGYGWSTGNETLFGRSNLFTAGSFFRPSIFFSAGVTGNFPAKGGSEGIVDLAVRPLGNEIISVFGDYVFRRRDLPGYSKWSAGAAFEFIPGIRLTGRYFHNDFFTTGIEYSFGRLGLSSQARFNKERYEYNTYGIRIGTYDRNIFDYFKRDRSFAEIDMKGGLKYQRFRFFDNSNTLQNILHSIKAAAEDKSSSGVVLNLSGMVINREMVWELRKELMDLKAKGKRVYIYFDRLDINGYHLASAADKIIMDQIGNLSLEGYFLGRTYFTGTLDKIGIGFNEIRNFRYKSAYESFSREEMSEADREQLQQIVNNNYELARKDISSARGFTSQQFDSLVNNMPFYWPDEAVEFGLADTIARWDKVQDIVNHYEREKKNFISPSLLPVNINPEDNYWGEKPKIGLVYALGVCAMDEGINARQLVKKLEAILKDPQVKAVVIRVDSPGGDALASDLISEKIKEYKYKKPIIISQGFVAASGGYWLSMYGDTIVAAPNTITGSIGVIGAWIYNQGLKESLGVSTDHVKRGTHADLPFGMSFPFIGLSLPDRNLSEREETIFRDGINNSYQMFVNKVSEGRRRSYDQIHEVAQGRVWSGIDGSRIGLIDVLGNLNTAIEIAAKRSGLKYGEYQIIEMPEPGLLDFNMFVPRLAGIKLTTEDPVIQDFRFRVNNMRKPLLMVPFEYTPELFIEY
jgi:protease IV